MKIIDCKKIREEILIETKVKLTRLFANKGIAPKLTIVQVGEDSASNTYIKNKIKTGESCGIEVEHIKLHKNIGELDLVRVIMAADIDEEVSGLMLQLPLPERLKKYEQSILNEIDSSKDVDGLSIDSVAKLWAGKPGLRPCTAEGCMKILENYELTGKHAVLVGRSNLCNKPLIQMLLQKDCTVTVTHSKTVGLKEITKSADIVICAIGKPKYFDASYFKDDAIVLDVGINRNEHGKLCGDVDVESLKDTNIHVTPTPGGTGALTTAMLMANVVKAYEINNGEIK